MCVCEWVCVRVCVCASWRAAFLFSFLHVILNRQLSAGDTM